MELVAIPPPPASQDNRRGNTTHLNLATGRVCRRRTARANDHGKRHTSRLYPGTSGQHLPQRPLLPRQPRQAIQPERLYRPGDPVSQLPLTDTGGREDRRAASGLW